MLYQYNSNFMSCQVSKLIFYRFRIKVNYRGKLRSNNKAVLRLIRKQSNFVRLRKMHFDFKEKAEKNEGIFCRL